MRSRTTPGALLTLLIITIAGSIVLGNTVVPRYLPGLADRVAGSPPTVPAPPAAPPVTAQPAPAQPAPAQPAPPASAPGGPSPLIGEEAAIIRVVERVRPAVVNIDTVAQVQTFFGVFPQQGAGSGVIVSPNGYILTNNHVVEGAQQIKVTLLSGRTLQGTVVGTDRFSDLAVIKVDSPEPLPAAQLGRSGGLRVGQMAVAIGNPFGLGHTVTVGVISALNRSIQVPGLLVENLIQTDAAINPGNSGGALANSAGEVIGINTAIVQQAQGIGFAIPIDAARAIMDQLISRGRVVRPFVGIAWGGDVDASIARQYRLPVDHGIIVREVEPGSPAARAGIRPGDIIVAVGGRSINNWNDFIRELFTKRPGDRVRIELVRDGRRLTVDVTLAERTQ
ncbi:MAG: trypsin-like peptidase domain-containing protein [Armatimonadota bacterium]|nr:trypsin-like peptidase domain-containing protein [Armatimonadota bacterium]MDR7451118.1 trypsin-like peptidase domain-containing protein [Armatimonadota bacterium]MDR7467277.1 trypsin-like peptidase domain-containing protein [Armatimonadota bacterium]MDR7494538.1 trypsin-like peptidase domain-containing protein [Armatimonadota bacterium]MDR7499885.1 trypsin-like peptidase domain-containing protein [Armatimonadota bacterium]